MKTNALFLVSTILCIAFCNATHKPTVKTNYGTLEGTKATNQNGRAYYAFKGIPYAKPPVDKLRWQRPHPLTPWENVRDASKHGDECSQFNQMVPDNQKTGSEDCLYLNVYVPEDPESLAGNEKAVMVFIHGGGFQMGSGNEEWYGPGKFMEHDVILVTFNYRLGIFGFLSTGDEMMSGNHGLWDQLEALQWVQDNIKAFGGDSKRVTIFGESAGAASVSFHLLSERSKGLFRNAIMQSGSAYSPWAMNEDPLTSAKAVANLLNCTSTESSLEIRKCMQDLPREDVFDAYVKYAVFPEMVPFYFAPVVEEKDDWSFLSDSPDVIIKKQRYNKVPFISGLMDNEHGLFLPILSQAFSNFDKGFYENRFEEYIKRTFDFSEEEIPLIADLFKRKYFGSVKNWDDHAQTTKPLNELFSDGMFNFPAFNFTNDVVRSGNPDNYFYQFTYRGKTSMTDNMRPDDTSNKHNLGAVHFDDIQYLFDSQFFGLKPLEGKDLELSNQLLTIWTNFAKFGEPTPKNDDIVKVNWEKVTKENFHYLDIGSDLVMKQNYLPERMKLWKNLYNKISKGQKISKDEL